MSDRIIYFIEYASDKCFNEYLPVDFFVNFADGKFDNNIYPKFSDRKAWEKAARSDYAERIINAANEIKDGDIPQLPFSLYRRFAVDGNRSDYEQLYFKRRENLAYLTLAMCLTGDVEKYIIRLLDQLFAIMEEDRWTIPAHSKWSENWELLMEYEPSDLFCCETGAVLAVMCHIVGEQLDKYCKDISGKLRKMILERTVYNIIYNKNTYFMHHWYDAEFPRNWTPWCSYNCLICAILLERDYSKLLDAINVFWSLSVRSVAIYNDEGYCDEGATYYNKSALMVFGTFQLMSKVQPHSMDKIFALPKVKNMFEFFANIQVVPGRVFSYADSQVSFVPHLHLMAPAAAMIGSELLMNVCNSYEKPLGMCGDYMLSGIGTLFDMPDNTVEKKVELPALSYYTDRVAVFRNRNFVVGGKAGCNYESHNHNDLGQFILYKGDEPIIIDAGTGVYSRENFGSTRYGLWYTRGAGHNAPVFGDIEQKDGKYFAKVADISENKMVMDLIEAYPDEAGVERFIRTIDIAEDSVSVSDDIALKNHLPVNITLVTVASDIKILSADKLQIGSVILQCENIFYDSSEIKPDFVSRQGTLWGLDFTLLHFKTDKLNYKFIFKGVEK